ncbi:TAXI family TRAP transporter solute-binding subunit [Anaplasma ovis]|uniref:TAXI family TRAP transporter solute-binding subunit n=1 Tax=Anaplasma ovis TaxID=142058 RepID=UPI0022780B8C|nr:TAXI family TRAP transporter solute-binding subunit [Anaplasma ovis]
MKLESVYATTALSDEMAYAIVKSIASNISRFHELSGALRKLTLRDLVTSGSAVPLHDGAERFYRETGMLK